MSNETKTTALPLNEITINFKGNGYIIKWPTSGQFIDIELLKSSLSDNGYASLFNSTRSAEWARLYIDTIATLNILVPQLSIDLNTKSILALPMSESIPLVKEFKKVYLPWYNEWMTILTNLGEDEDE